MLKFTSVSVSAQGITAITLTVTTIRTGIIIDLIIGTADTAITGITIPIIIDTDLIRNSHTGLVRTYFEPACFF